MKIQLFNYVYFLGLAINPNIKTCTDIYTRHDWHHKVSSSVNGHKTTPYSLRYEVNIKIPNHPFKCNIYKAQVTKDVKGFIRENNSMLNFILEVSGFGVDSCASRKKIFFITSQYSTLKEVRLIDCFRQCVYNFVNVVLR